MKKLILLLVIISVLKSCTVSGLGDDYKKLSDNQKSTILNLEKFDDLKHHLIYKISGKQLSEELRNHPKAMVYIFTNGTKLRIKPLKDYESYAANNGYKLFFVMDGYMNLNETISGLSTSHNPLFVINKDIYNKNFKPTYTRLFIKDLGIKKEDSIKYSNGLLFFENGKFIKLIEEYSGFKSKKEK